MRSGGGSSSPPSGRDGPQAPGKPPRAASRGHKFRVGQEGVNGSPLPAFTRAPLPGWGGAVLGAPSRAPPPRPPTHVRTQLAHPLLSTLARTTASGSTHTVTPVVSHVTHDARAPAAWGGAPQLRAAGCGVLACEYITPSTACYVPSQTLTHPLNVINSDDPVSHGYRIHVPHVGTNLQ